MAPVKHKYHLIGIQLGVQDDMIKQIEEDHTGCDRRFSEVLSKWLNRNGDPISWDSVVSAVESPSVADKKLGETLREKYITPKEVISQGILSCLIHAVANVVALCICIWGAITHVRTI